MPPLRLAELQREAIALADLLVLLAVALAEPVVRRQGPHSLRMIPGVFRVGVEFRARHEFEARGGGERDGVVLVDVTARGTRILRPHGISAMVDHDEDAA